MVVAAALLVDYIMTVAVSVAAGVDNIISALPGLNSHRVALAVGFVVLLTLMNLRGVRESGKTFAVPTYLFVLGILSLIGVGLPKPCWAMPPLQRARGIRSAPSRPVSPGSPSSSSPCGPSRQDAPPSPGRGDQQRGSGLPPAQGSQRGADPLGHGRHRHRDVQRDHRPGDHRPRPRHREPLRPRRVSGQLRNNTPAHRHRPTRCGRVRRHVQPRSSTTSRPPPPSSSSSRPTRHTTASRCSPRSSPDTGSCRPSSTPAATGSPTATGSSPSLPSPVPSWWPTRPR